MIIINNNKQIKQYKVKINLNTVISFQTNDTVNVRETNAKGIISKITNDTIFVKYSDGTIERFKRATAKQYLEYLDEDMVNIPIANKKAKVKNIKQTNNTEDDSKINQLVMTAYKKGMILKDEIEQQKLMCSMMSEQDLIDFENRISAFNENIKTTSNEQQEDDENLTEAERMLKKIKQSGAIIHNFDLDNLPDNCRTLDGANANPFATEQGIYEHINDINDKSNDSMFEDLNNYLNNSQLNNNQSNNSQQKTDNTKKAQDIKSNQNIQYSMPNNITNKTQNYDKYDFLNNLDWSLGGK